MSDSNPPCNVESIVQELREGMADTTPLQQNVANASGMRHLKLSLRKANETTDVLGRCGGSLRGRLCLQLARLALPVVEQLNAHHAAVVLALTQLQNLQPSAAAENGSAPETLEARLAKVEAALAELKAGQDS